LEVSRKFQEVAGKLPGASWCFRELSGASGPQHLVCM
jgi:hypothetical protein